MPAPRRLRLLKVTPEGYLVGSGETRTNTHVLVPHEVAVAILTGLADPLAPQVQAVAGDYPDGPAILADAARTAQRQLGGVAWRLGVCSWDRQGRAIPRDGNPFHQSD